MVIAHLCGFGRLFFHFGSAFRCLEGAARFYWILDFLWLIGALGLFRFSGAFSGVLVYWYFTLSLGRFSWGTDPGSIVGLLIKSRFS